MDPIPISPALTLPADELSFRAVRAGGPGGQNVNKVSSKVELSFALDESSVPVSYTHLTLPTKRIV